MKTKELSKKYKNYVIDMRREFHRFPEASLQEYRTSARIKEELDRFGIQSEIIADTGVIATIVGKYPGRTVALRGDIDALAVVETSSKEYASKNLGLMHACGHDTHAAMLLGSARVLNDMRDNLNGTVKFLFQPGEEVARGALKMIEAGALENVDNIFGMHISSDLPCGTISADSGPRCASADIFSLKIVGKGGHGARPEQCVDAVVVGSAIVMNLQSVVSREFSPLEPTVLTVGSIKSGTRFNVIAPTAILEGTTRCYNLDIRKNFPKIIERVAKSTAEAYRAKAELTYTYGVGPTINNETYADLAQKSAQKLVGAENVISRPPSTGGEDFSEFSNRIPGVMVNLGGQNKEKGFIYPHHHEKFDIDEEALEIGTAFYAQYAIDYLNLN
ncbi:amidohydrolase [uncultured Cetobacterium sp.]|uniref:amidohydrolase n=1 Tax=uncultured Cetobacterium sp. TaxID=527638 RepID=UPI0026362D98|nr:amidohydrolase [uncultured Cetobacterium sp.]